MNGSRLIARIVFDRWTTGALITDAMRLALAPGAVHCRTLDRLHLAAMIGFGHDRLLTNDDALAHAAEALGFTVLMPR